MNEIRFNAPRHTEPPKNEISTIQPEKDTVPNKKSYTSKLVGALKILSLLAIVVLLVAFIVPIVKNSLVPKLFNQGRERYSAVFLTNGQVYFGKMRSVSKSEIVLENVYYLQANADGTTPSSQNLGSSFRLVKLGNELHGPTDELFVNRSQVVFYEYLRDDSKVVESINKQ